MKQVEINAEIRITYKIPDDDEINSVEELEEGLAIIFEDELGTNKDEDVKVRVRVRGIDVMRENG